MRLHQNTGTVPYLIEVRTTWLVQQSHCIPPCSCGWSAGAWVTLPAVWFACQSIPHSRL